MHTWLRTAQSEREADPAEQQGSANKPSGARAVEQRPGERFDQALTREIIRSERIRLTIVAILLGLGFVRQIVAWITPGLGEGGAALASGEPWALTALGGLALAYELYAISVASRALRTGRLPSNLVRYRNTVVEISWPTAFVICSIELNSPADLYVIPVAWFYLALIVLSTLHLDFWLCALTGLVAGLEYAWLRAHYAGVAAASLLDPGLMSPVWPELRIGLLVGCGLVAGLISLRIRQQFAAALRSIQERDRVVGVFGQHVSPAVVDQLLNGKDEPGSELREVCVMFLDIQGFTTFAENRRPAEVVEYLNTLFAVMIGLVNRHHGIVNKFLGDGFMAIFGAPIADRDAARNGVAAALQILDEVEAMSASGAIAPTTLRLGLHAGEVVTGTVGSAARKEYTIIGDVVNVASRLEQMNKDLGTRLLATHSVVERLQPAAARTTMLGSVQVRGREHPVDVYEVA
jgi:adenylate cyclase